MQPTSRAGPADSAGEAGFTLLETVCILAIVAMMAGIVLPSVPFGASKPRLQGYAVQIAALLNADRNAAIRGGRPVSTFIDTSERVIRSGGGSGSLQLPTDVKLSASLATRCGDFAQNSSVIFLGSGMSCGGSIFVRRGADAYRIRVNWITGGIEIGGD